MRAFSTCLILIWTTLVCANVEKTIFLAPKAIHIPIEHPNLDDLRLDTLTPSHLTLRRRLAASFPNNTHEKGTEAWFLLDGLKQDQRYEVRICWSATVRRIFSLWIGNAVIKSTLRFILISQCSNQQHSLCTPILSNKFSTILRSSRLLLSTQKHVSP